MKKIDSFFAKASVTWSSQSLSSNSVTFPCPGLQESSYSQVGAYLERSGAHGGGGPSISSLTAELFGKKYWKLSPSHKRQVKTAQHHEWLWRNDHEEGVVYSTACIKEVQHNSCTAAEELPCQKCGELLTLKAFKNIVHKPHPTDEKYRHVNNEYQNDCLASLFGHCSGLHKIIKVSAACQFTLHHILTNFTRTSLTIRWFTIVKGSPLENIKEMTCSGSCLIVRSESFQNHIDQLFSFMSGAFKSHFQKSELSL